MTRVLSLLCIAAVAGCAAQPPQSETRGRLGSVGYTLTERAHDGAYDVPIDKRFTVDADSSLELRFEVGAANALAAEDPLWIAINAWLEETSGLSQRLVELNRRTVNADDIQALRQLQQEVIDFNKRVVALQAAAKKILEDAGLNDAEVRAVLLGTFDGKRESVIRNVTRWVLQQREELLAAARRKQTGHEQQVVVMAFHKVAGQTRERLHVEHYDTISAGMDLALKRTALGLTERELGELNMQIEQSERAARLIRQLQTDRGALAKLRTQVYSKLKEKLTELQQLVETAGDKIRAQLKSASERVRAAQRNATLDPQVRTQLDILSKQVESLRQDWEAVVKAKDNIERIRKAPASGDISRFLFGNAGVLENLQAIGDAVAALEGWPKRIADIEMQARQVAAALREAEWPDLLPLDFKAEGAKLKAAVEPIKIYIGTLVEQKGADQGLQALAAAGDETVPRRLDELLPARIDLRGYRFEQDDGVTIRVELHESIGTVKTGTPKQLNEYNLDVREQAWYRRVSGIPIFARANSGTADAKKWKPNIGVTAAWYYQERFPNKFGEFMNWLEPGIGIHVASLDQGEDSVEFGLGVNVSFWKGLLTLGVGRNLNVSGDGSYLLLGSDLFRLLGRLEPGK